MSNSSNSNQKRPGTVDYSHFDNIDYSSSDSEDDDDDDDEEEEEYTEDQKQQRMQWLQEQTLRPVQENAGQRASSHHRHQQQSSNNNNNNSNNNNNNSEIQEVTKVSATQNLSMLQRAWGRQQPHVGAGDNTTDNVTTTTTTSNNNNNNNEAEDGAADGGTEDVAPSSLEMAKKLKVCVACNTADPRFKCSRCQLVWYCGKDCQRSYHPIHRQECVDASKHYAYWGIFNNTSSTSGGDADGDAVRHQTKEEKMATLKKILESRMASRRRKALKRAAAKAAIERARRARESARPGQNVGKGKGKQAPKEETCSICQCEFTFGESLEAAGSLCCPGSHYMCAECTGVYVKSVVSDLETSYPPKCSLCRAHFDEEHFERQLTATQQHSVQVFATKQKLKPGQELIECDTCSSLAIVTTAKTADAEPSVFWWCNDCENGKCLVCLKELPPYDPNNLASLKSCHAICGKLRHTKAKIEYALEAGSKQSCPACGLAGLKDDACTHMKCPKCECDWCYVCGLDVATCDKAAPRTEDGEANDIYLHNQDWEVNANRCPMYLTQILEVDLGWMGEDWEDHATDEDFEDDARCLEYFHRFQTIKKLQEVRDLVGHEAFSLAFETFSSIKNAGYSLAEIIETDTTVLIDREEYIRYQAEHPDEDDEDGSDGADDDLDALDDGASLESSGDEADQLQEAIERSRTTEVEDQQIRDAIERSRASETEDQQTRDVIEQSRTETQGKNTPAN